MIFPIVAIEEGSIAAQMGIKPGSFLIEINGKEIEDRLDYLFLTTQDYLTVLIEEDGEEVLLEIEKDDDEDLGFIFEHPLMDEARRCHNNCVFCFIDQLPKGLRSSLYFKDDDSRLSFMQGNFVTLTNVGQDQLSRIVDYGIHPINISIHSLDPEIRVKMMGSPKAQDIKKQLDYLYANKVKMNGQIVLVPNFNDGASLYKTLDGLLEYIPHLSSVAIVPVGLSDHRQGLTELRNFTSEEAGEIIEKITLLQKKNINKYGTRFVFLADEFYLLAGKELPPAQEYEGYVQIENGVGLVRQFIDELHRQMKDITLFPDKRISIVTGKLFGPVLEKELYSYTLKGLNISVQEIENNFFGEKITVSGLLSYKDLKEQISLEKVDVLLLPSSMLNYDDKSLDDISKKDIVDAFTCDVFFIEPEAKALIDKIKEVSHGTSSSHCRQT
ncbi:MAG TPA: DUF512 domain-containing protein [Clostridia bacterium]|nr:DUF512 domain-containing protein [Clostridia bacterium]